MYRHYKVSYINILNSQLTILLNPHTLCNNHTTPVKLASLPIQFMIRITTSPTRIKNDTHYSKKLLCIILHYNMYYFHFTLQETC